MTFAVAQDKSAPEFTTVASYAVTRLGPVQTLSTGFAETRRGWLTLTVLGATDADTDGVYESLNVQPPAEHVDPSGLVGRELLSMSGAGVGTVGTVEVVHGVQTFWQLTLSSGGLHNAESTQLQTAQLNAFGLQVNNPAQTGREWTLSLSSESPSQSARMAGMLLGIQVACIRVVLDAFAVSKSTEEILAAAAGMFAAGTSVESLIASAMEQVEVDRRAGTLTDVTVFGNAPRV